MYERVNGWTNWETWITALWLSNDYGVQKELEAQAEEALQQCDADHEAATELVETFINVLLDELFNQEQASLISDILSHARNQINDREIAESYVNS